jgi:hypothetical protein
MSLPSKDEARLCASVVRDIARRLNFSDDPAAVGKLTVVVARLFNSGLRTRDELISAAMQSTDLPNSERLATSQG